jgi:uncharacterized protein (DUF488 family)
MEEFLEILKAHDIKQVVDVRRFPGSKKFPHFNKENLEKVLTENGIGYSYLGNLLGGFRKGGYRNYTQTKEFKEGLMNLLEIAKNFRTAIMCAEVLWFRCHRRYISNELVKLGHQVVHIIDQKRSYEHKLPKNTNPT